MTKGGTEAIGNIARAREDAANGTSQFIAVQKRLDTCAQHIVSKALRRSIADAYAAYAGQVEGLPMDDYGLALYALEKTYSVGSGSGTGRHSFNLQSSPFCNSKAKHCAISNTARKILQNLDFYVHEVATLAPGELNKLANREPVYDNHGNQIPWNPEVAASKALYGTTGKSGSPATQQVPVGASVTYPPRTSQQMPSARYNGERDRSSTPPEQMRGALVGTPHRPSTLGAGRQARTTTSPTRPATGPAAGMQPHVHSNNRIPGQGHSGLLGRSQLHSQPAADRHGSSSLDALAGGSMEKRSAEWQRRNEEQWGMSEEDVCARAAMQVVTAAAAAATVERDPILQQQQRCAKAMLDTVQEQQEREQVRKLAQARLPGVVRLPPHLRVSHYYDHVRPPAPLKDFHVSLLSHGQHPPRTQSPQRPHSPQRSGSPHQSPQQFHAQQQQQQQQQDLISQASYKASPVSSHTTGAGSGMQAKESMAMAALASDLGVPIDAAQQLMQAASRQQQQLLQNIHGGKGVIEGAVNASNMHQQHPPGTQPSSNSIARSLGFHVISDSQLLDIITLFKEGVVSGLSSQAELPKATFSGLHAPPAPALNGTGLFNACNFNRSRRLMPTNVQLHHMRTSGTFHPQQPMRSSMEPGGAAEGAGDSVRELGDEDGVPRMVQPYRQQEVEGQHSTTSVGHLGGAPAGRVGETELK